MHRKPHSSPSGQNHREMMGDRLQRADVWRNYAPASNSNGNSPPGCLGDHRYDNRALFPPLEEPRHASKRQQQPKSSQGDIWRNYGGNSNSPQRQSRQSSRTVEQPPRFDLVQPQSGIAQALLPHWVRMKDMMWPDSLTSNSSSSTQPVPQKQEAAAGTETETETALDESDFEPAEPLEEEHSPPSPPAVGRPPKPKPKPMATLTARVIAREGPFGASSTIELVPSGRGEGAPLDACCVNLVFESFGMIGISTQADDPQVYDIKRSPNFLLTSDQKQRLHDAIEQKTNGQVLDALQKVIQEIRDEIDQMSQMMSEMTSPSASASASARQEEHDMTSEPPGVFDHSMWTWCNPTPNKSANVSPVSGYSSPKIHSFVDNNLEDNYGHNATTRPRTFRTKSYGAWNRTESGSDSPKASSNAGGARSESGYPGDTDRSFLDFSQPPFPHHS